MWNVATQRPYYSKAERFSDGIVHVLGLTWAIASVPVLITLAVMWHTGAPAIVGASIYGGTLIAMLLFSALYNIFEYSDWARLLRGLDHAGIYFKIAGTYTPFTLMSGGQGVWLLTGLWGAAFAGAGIKLAAPFRFKWLSLGMYLGMGWAALFLGHGMLDTLSTAVLVLIVVGGLLYTAGVIFLLWDSLPYHNTIWHVFVLAASVVFFSAVLVRIAQAAP
ncbi:MAG: hemolysin III family protein [Pseudomonadota bacterium]